MAITAPSDISGLVLDLDPHVSAWQDAAGTTVAAVADVVGRVDDQSGGGFHVTQATTAGKPTLQEDANGWRHLLLDGIDDYLSNASFMPTSGGAQPFTGVLVYLVDSSLATNQVVAAPDQQQFLNSRTGDYQVNYGANLRRGTPDRDVRHIAQVEVNGASSLVFIDNVQQGTAGSPGTSAWAAGIWWGIYSTLISPHKGQSYRLLVYDRVLTSQERTDLYTYLDDLYSNPAGGGDPEPIGLSASEGSVAGSTFTPRLIIGASITEGATGADSDAPQATLRAAGTDGALSGEAYAAALRVLAALSAGAQASESWASGLLLSASVTEGTSASDAFAAAVSSATQGAVAEGSAAGAAFVSGLAALASIIESGRAGEVFAALASMAAAYGEGASAGAAFAVTSSSGAAITEGARAGDAWTSALPGIAYLTGTVRIIARLAATASVRARLTGQAAINNQG